jgi:hypothetical protein
MKRTPIVDVGSNQQTANHENIKVDIDPQKDLPLSFKKYPFSCFPFSFSAFPFTIVAQAKMA